MSTEVVCPIPPTEAERLEAQLRRRLGNRVRNLRVQVSPRGLVLQGRAASYHAKQLAQHAAMTLCELPILTNAIEVI